MKFNEFLKYAKHPEYFTAEEVNEFEFMTNRELDKYQRELEKDGGNLSDWDHIRAIFTFQKEINQLKRMYFTVLNENEELKCDLLKVEKLQQKTANNLRKSRSKLNECKKKINEMNWIFFDQNN